MIYSTGLLAAALVGGVAGAKQAWPWSTPDMTPKQRAVQLLTQMTVEEKVTMLHGQESSEYSGVVEGNERLGIPTLKLSDGPQGMRDNNHPGTTTAFPSALAVAATWDLDLCRQWGEAMGEEFYNKGSNVQLGPGMNIARVPLNGRNFEYMSGGDSFLGYKVVQPVIQGIQSKGVIANAKHWVENNQETDRNSVSENVDERTRHEFYYRPFAGAVDAGVGSFMCSYNKINSLWSCENPETLGDLKEHLGFSGWVMSDWGATHSLSIEQGLDQEMPGEDYFGQTLLDAVADGSVSERTVDDAVMRILVPMFEVGLFDYENDNELANDVRTEEHTALTRAISAASHVLLKNENSTLPLSLGGGPKKIALFGGGVRAPIIAGGGSGAVFPSNVVTPFAAMLEILGIADKNPVLVTCDPGAYTSDMGFDQSGCQSAPSSSVDDCAMQCSEYELCSYFTFSNGRCEFYPTNAKRRPAPGAVSGSCVREFAQPTSTWQCNSADVCVASLDGSNLQAVSRLAEEADVAIVVVGTFAKEGSDRESLSFAEIEGNMCQVAPKNQDDMIPLVAARTSTIVAMTGPAAVLTPWRNEVRSLLYGFYPGEEYGHALMDIIFGAVNPSGRLPLTLPNVENEVGFSRAQFPGIAENGFYTEGMYVDYRWYSAHNVSPAYSFGHGLSYTSFEYYDFTVLSPNDFSVSVRNAGRVPGAEVAQLYFSFPEEAETPPLQLRGFQKTALLQPGESETVTFHVDDVDLSVWRPKRANRTGGWELAHGTFAAFAGASSTDLRLRNSFEV